MFPALIGLGLSAYSAYKGHKAEKKSNEMNDRAVRQRELEYNERAPLRRQGMQALGQVEAPMDLGNLGYNPSNPFAAARGPSKDPATMGNWGRMTYEMPQEPAPMAAQGVPQDMLAQLPRGAPPALRRALEQGMAKRGMTALGGGR